MVGDLVEQEQGPGGGFLEGHISVGAVLEAQSREIYAIQISKTNRDPLVRQIEQRARGLGVPVQRVEPAVIEAQASGHTHGGVLAQVGPRTYRVLGDLLTLSACPFIVMLDGIEDPFNFGAAVRCLYAAGVDGLVLRPRNWMSAAAVVARASGGASEIMPTAIAETALSAADALRQEGLVIACAARGHSVSVFEAQLDMPLFLVIGGEKRGISRPLVEQADLRLEIPYGRRWAVSLGTAAATAVLAFEIMRQRRVPKGDLGS